MHSCCAWCGVSIVARSFMLTVLMVRPHSYTVSRLHRVTVLAGTTQQSSENHGTVDIQIQNVDESPDSPPPRWSVARCVQTVSSAGYFPCRTLRVCVLM